MSADFVVRWADWSGGNFGTLDPAYANKNQYSGQNIQRYNSGLIGPRAGLKALTINWGAYPGTHPVLGPYGFDMKDGNLLITLGTRTHRIPIAAPTTNPYNVYPAAPTRFVRFAQANRVLYGLRDGDLFKHEDSGVVTQIALPAGVKLSQLVRWGYYLIGVDEAKPFRLWHSTVTIAGSNFDLWGPNSFLDVGGNMPIVTLKPIFNSLYAGKTDGWYAISGVLGELASVRARTIANGPIDDRQTTVTTDNRILYWPQDSMPAWFNGDRVDLDRDYELTGFDTAFASDTVVATPTGQRLIMVGERTTQTVTPRQSGMLLWDKAWSTHTFDIPISGVVCGDVRNGTGLPEGIVFMCQRPTTIGDPIVIASFQTDPNRPAHATDAWAAPRDTTGTKLVTGTIDLPAHWSGDGRHLRVKNVIVQFRKWPSGIAGTRNELQCRVVPLGTYGGGTVNSEIKLWTEPSDRSDVIGTDDSHVFGVGEGVHAAGFQVQFPVVRGVAIRDVIVEVEARSQRT